MKTVQPGKFATYSGMSVALGSAVAATIAPVTPGVIRSPPTVASRQAAILC